MGRSWFSKITLSIIRRLYRYSILLLTGSPRSGGDERAGQHVIEDEHPALQRLQFVLADQLLVAFGDTVEEGSIPGDLPRGSWGCSSGAAAGASGAWTAPCCCAAS